MEIFYHPAPITDNVNAMVTPRAPQVAGEMARRNLPTMNSVSGRVTVRYVMYIINRIVKIPIIENSPVLRE